MQLAITALGTKTTLYLAEVLSAISNCKCNVVELRTSQLATTSAAYLLIEGNWNHIAKLENILDGLQDRLGIQFQSMRPETTKSASDGIPYSLETLSLYRNDVIQDITAFLMNRDIGIEEISASRYLAPYCQSPIFSTRFILTIPPEIRLLSLREEFLDFCDNLNLDAILEPIKR
ncbi:ACT domain-containing protein [Methylomarinum sp. Ch1-1]|uniref:Glycine cleavage system transcriptional repressor n=1 Tax=Methylomarinum roseum TaxID=3067653 RepID=A0AAU7NPR0_9GAMM|nr:ACT domain-containing protein [Methylomarinum sp. Ch1-1]MDP4521128.1 ACT domain-containing protein [Methylomarinum sp. Ch1-1]